MGVHGVRMHTQTCGVTFVSTHKQNGLSGTRRRAAQSSCYCGAASIIVPPSLLPRRHAVSCASRSPPPPPPWPHSLFFHYFFPFCSPPPPTLPHPRSRHLSLSVLPLCRFELLIIYVVAPLLSLLASAAARPPCTSSICFSLVPSLCSTPPSALPLHPALPLLLFFFSLPFPHPQCSSV